MKNIYLNLLGLILISTSVFSQDKIQIEAENKLTQNHFGIDEFYFVHQTFADAFFMTNLNKQLSYDEMSQILKAVYYGVTDKDKVTITIKQDNSPDARLVFFSKNHAEDGNMLVMMTNFNSSTRKFEKELNDTQSIVRWYFIRGEKLVYRKDLYTKAEEKKKKKGDPHELIDYYLYDDNNENDSKVKTLIDNLLISNESPTEKLYAKLYLGEFLIINNEVEKAENSIADLKKYFDTETKIPRAYSMIVDMAKTELEVYKRLTN